LFIKFKRDKRKAVLFDKIFVMFLAVFGILFLWGNWIIWGKEVIPYTKTHFKSYESFCEKAKNDYPNKLPDSANDIQYYYHTEKFDHTSAVAFSVNSADFTSLSKDYIEWYLEWTKDSSWDVEYQNVALSENFIVEENLYFLKDVTDNKLDDYKIVEYIGNGSSDIRNMSGVLGNESTGRIIIFDCRDAFPE